MTAPQFDVLRPSPLDLGGVISGAFKTMKQRFGQFVVLALIPNAIMFVLLMIAIVVLMIGIVAAISELRFSSLIILGVALMFVAMVVGLLAQIKIQAMITLGAHDVIHHRPSTAGELSQRTSGVIGRVLLLMLGVIAAVFIAYGLITGIFMGIIFGGIAASNSLDDPGAAIGTIFGAYLLMLVFMAALGFFMFYLMVRFLYFLPVLAVEGMSAVDSLRRSWQMTKGNVLRTFGYYFIASLLVYVASYVVSLIGQLMWLPALSNTSSYGYPYDPAAQVMTMVPGIIVTGLLSFALQVLALPFLTSYITVMYVDQLRRASLPAGYRPGAYQPAPYMAPGQPPFGAPPGQWQPVNPPEQQWGQQPPQQQWGQQP